MIFRHGDVRRAACRNPSARNVPMRRSGPISTMRTSEKLSQTACGILRRVGTAHHYHELNLPRDSLPAQMGDSPLDDFILIDGYQHHAQPRSRLRAVYGSNIRWHSGQS